MSPIEVPAKIQLVEKRESTDGKWNALKGLVSWGNPSLLWSKATPSQRPERLDMSHILKVMASLIAQVLEWSASWPEYALMPHQLFPTFELFHAMWSASAPSSQRTMNSCIILRAWLMPISLPAVEPLHRETLFQYAIELYSKWLYQMLAFDAFYRQRRPPKTILMLDRRMEKKKLCSAYL